ncbi:MAG: CotH kinase family protein [Chloroflexota bacterium]
MRHTILAALAASLLLLLLGLGEDNNLSPTSLSSVQFSLESGAYKRDIVVRLHTSQPDATILYTTNGRLPAPTTAQTYSSPFYLTANPPTIMTIQARTVGVDGVLGEVKTAVYAVGLQATVPIMAVTMEPDDLWGAATGIFANPEERGIEWERPLTLTYLDENGRLAFQIPAGGRVHGLTSRLYEKKSLRLYFRQEYGPPRLDYPLFPDSDVTSFKRLVLHSGGQDYPAQRANGTLLRNALMAQLARQVNGYATHIRPVLLILNGERWGIYNLRERVDENYLHDHFGIEPDSDDLAHWPNLNAYIDSHDLSEPEHYAYVQTQIDINNFIDYNILQMLAANTDWPNNNRTRFRDHGADGRWRWLFWDTDFAFGLAPNSRIETDMMERVFLREREDIVIGAKLMRELIKNSAFQAQFVARADYLLAHSLHPEQLLGTLDGLAAELAPNIHHETERWPGGSTWEASVEEMRVFVQERPFVFEQNLRAMFAEE